jgi:uncharacterized protein (DUF1499 family)
VRKWLLMLVAAGLIFVSATLIVAQRPGELGLVDGALRRCAAGDACVNSQLGEGEQRIAPLYVGPNVEQAWQELLGLVRANSSASLRVVESHYLRVEWVQAWLPYPNDLEFLRFDSGGLIHVRSAGRVGSFGLGGHLQLVEELSKDVAEAMGSADGS